MKNRLGVLSLVACSIVISFAAGCQSKSQQAAAPTVLRIAHGDAVEHPSTAGIRKLAETLKVKSGGRLILNDFPNSQLGSNTQITDAVANGSLDMAAVSGGELGKREKSIMIMDGPYLIRDTEHMMKIINGPIGQEMWDKLAASSHITVLGGYYYGTRYVTTGNKAVRTPTDMAGFKLRVPNTQTSIAIARAMGAQPTPIDIGEVYLALQQGVANGQENPIPVILAQRFNEVQKYLILTGHQKPVQFICINEQKLKSLPPDLQQLLKDEVKNTTVELSKTIAETEKKQLEEIKAKKQMQVIEPDIEALKKSEQAVYKELAGVWGEGLYEKIESVK